MEQDQKLAELLSQSGKWSRRSDTASNQEQGTAFCSSKEASACTNETGKGKRSHTSSLSRYLASLCKDEPEVDQEFDCIVEHCEAIATSHDDSDQEFEMMARQYEIADEDFDSSLRDLNSPAFFNLLDADTESHQLNMLKPLTREDWISIEIGRVNTLPCFDDSELFSEALEREMTEGFDREVAESLAS